MRGRGGGVINQVVTGGINMETERAINDWNIPLTLRNPKIRESKAEEIMHTL